jgi:hypothetical protein
VIAAVLAFLFIGNPIQNVEAVPPQPVGRQSWTAEWISHPTAEPRARGVFH